jgi:hypothetical protein
LNRSPCTIMAQAIRAILFDRPTVREPEPLRPVLARVSDDSHRARPRPDENTFQSPSRRAVVNFDQPA